MGYVKAEVDSNTTQHSFKAPQTTKKTQYVLFSTVL